MKIVTKRILISVIMSFLIFFLNYNILGIRMGICIIFAIVGYFVINKIIDDCGNDSFYDALNDKQIETLSNYQMNNCMYYYKRKLVIAIRLIKNPKLKTKAERFARSVDNAINCIASKHEKNIRLILLRIR